MLKFAVVGTGTRDTLYEEKYKLTSEGYTLPQIEVIFCSDK